MRTIPIPAVVYERLVLESKRTGKPISRLIDLYFADILQKAKN